MVSYTKRIAVATPAKPYKDCAIMLKRLIPTAKPKPNLALILPQRNPWQQEALIIAFKLHNGACIGQGS